MKIKALWKKLEVFNLEQCTDLVIPIPNRELECKLDTSNLNLLAVYHQLKRAGDLRYDGLPYRRETHYVYEVGGVSMTLIVGPEEVWIKQKKNNDTIQIPTLNISILDRMETKMNPRNPNYQKTLAETLACKPVGSFEKECFDLCLKRRNLHFTITYAVSSSQASQLSQMEIEYEGYSLVNTHTIQPDLDEIVGMYKEILVGYLSEFVDKFTSLKKIDWLKGLNSRE